MKKINILMLATLLSTSLLTSCGSKASNELSKLSQIILNNLQEEKNNDNRVAISKKTSISKTDLELNESNPYLAKYGVYYQVDSDYTRFNSLFYSNYLGNKKFDNNLFSGFEITRDELIGDIFQVNYIDGSCSVYERHGYTIFEGYESPKISASKHRLDNKARVVIKVSSSLTKTAYFYFDENGTKINVYDFNEEYNPEEVIFGIKKGDEIGLKDHYYSVNKIGNNDSYKIVSIFDKSFKGVSNFSIPNDVSFSGVISNLFFYQEYKVHNVDYKDEYTLSSYVVDCLTGETKSIDLKYVINGDIHAYKDEKGEYTLGVVNAKKVLEDKSITSRESTLLINKKGQIVQDLSGVQPLAFIKASEDTIFNTSTNILYNNDLTTVVSLGTKFNYISENGFIVGENEGKYGAYDLSLNQCVAFTYDYLSTDTLNGELLGIKDGQLYLVNSNGSAAIDVYDDSIKSVELLESGVFVASTEDNEKIIIGNKGNTFKLLANSPVLSFKDEGTNESYYVYNVENLIDPTLNDFITVKKVVKE